MTELTELKKDEESLEKKQLKYIRQQEMGIKRVSLERLHKQALNVLSREVKGLLKISYHDALTPMQAKALCDYMKLIRELKKQEDDELNELSDEELEKLLKEKK